MHCLLISDLHLSPQRPAVSQAFLAFLADKASRSQALFILGDLFEAWIGDDDPAPLAREVMQALKILTDKGVSIYFQPGNRDFLVGKKFARQTGCTLLPDYYVAEFNGVKTLLSHGDLFCSEDIDYQRFRKRVRKPVIRWMLSHLPLKRRQKIADDWRKKSIAANANKSDNIMDVCEQTVEQQFVAFGVTQMIHGHTHRPASHQHKNGTRLVLGDWHHSGWYISTEDNTLTLHEFPIQPLTGPE